MRMMSIFDLLQSGMQLPGSVANWIRPCVLSLNDLIAEPGAHRRHVCSLNHQMRRLLHRGSSISIPTRLHRRPSTPVPNFRSRRPWHSQFDELAFWLLDCNSFTTCLTLGTEEAICSACARTELDSTSPVRVTTPFLTSYFTFLCSPFWMRAASKFFSMPVSRSEFIALAALSPPGGITAI